MSGWRMVLFVAGGVVVVAFVMFFGLASLDATDGGRAGGVLQAVRPVTAAAVVGAAFLVGGVVAAGVARMTSDAMGFLTLGLGVGVVSLRTGTLVDLVMRQERLALLPLETLAWAIALALTTLLITREARGERPVPAPPEGATPAWRSPRAWLAAAAVAVYLPGVWLVARSTLPAQALAASAAGATVAVTLARLIRPGLPAAVPALGLVVAAVAGQTVAGARIGWRPDQLEAAFRAGELSPWLAPMPLHHVAGILLGLGLGIAWARGLGAVDGLRGAGQGESDAGSGPNPPPGSERKPGPAAPARERRTPPPPAAVTPPTPDAPPAAGPPAGDR